MDFDHDSGSILSSITGFVVIAGTGGLQVPTGTTAQRPASAGFGTIRINSTNSTLEFFNNSTWQSFGDGVTSVALTLPSIFSVSGSPITTAGTLTASLVSQASNTVLAAPSGLAGTPAFRTLAISDLSNVSSAAPSVGSVLAFTGALWAPAAVTNSSASGILSSWTSIGGTPARFTSSFSHNLGTFNLVITVFDTVTNNVVIPDNIQLTSTNAVLVTVASNTRSLRIVCVVNGNTANIQSGTPSSVIVQNQGTPIGSYTAVNFAGGGVSTVDSGSGVATVTVPAAVLNAGGSPSVQQGTLSARPTAATAGRLYISTDNSVIYRDTGSVWTPLTPSAIRTLSYVAASLDTPNSSDWVVNALAPAVPDPLANSLTVRQFSQTTEQGTGATFTVPGLATSVTITLKCRLSAAITGATNVVQPRVYRRNIPASGSIGAWGAAVELSNISFPASSTAWVYATQTLTLSSLGWTPGNLTLIEMTRRTAGVTGGVNVATPWLLAELQLEFF